MAQYSVNRGKAYHLNNTDIHEVTMIADQWGNIINEFGTSSSAQASGNYNAKLDAFGRQRMSTPYTLFDSHNLLSKNNKFDEDISGGMGLSTVTYDSDGSEVQLNVTGVSGAQVVRQSYRNFSYQPGKSLLILNTFTMNEPKENLRQRVGYFNTSNGIFLEQDDSTAYMVLRNNGSETRIAQSSWNVDRIDGTGTSKLTLDLTKAQIFWMDIEWLGVGSVRTGFVINGQFVVAHIFHNSNLNVGVYMTTPNLPIRYEITNTDTTSGSSTLKQVCSTVLSEGGYEARAVEHVIGTALTGVTVGTAYSNLVTIRMKRPGPIVVPAGADILNISNTDFEWAFFKNVTPASSFTWATATDNVEYAINTVGFTSNGTRIAGGFMGGKTAPVSFGDGFAWDYQLGETIAGVSDTLTLAVRSASSSKTAAGLMKWVEL
jgi:hypothetical protein